jgi:predicted nucleic acid-binding protein
MTRYVIDASAALAYLLDEPRPYWVDGIMAEARGGESELLAPAFLWLEIGNCLARLHEMADEVALEAMLRAEAFGIELVETDRPIRLRTLTLARQHRLTMYDALYLAVAETLGAPLLTLDVPLERAADSMGLGRGGGDTRIGEPPVGYGDRPVDTTSLAAIGAALAEMREQYEL